jgi:phage shock protein B
MFAVIMIVVPALLLDYRLKTQRMRAAAKDNGATQGLWDAAQRMEARIGYLETVLDSEVPGWRNRSTVR